MWPYSMTTHITRLFFGLRARLCSGMLSSEISEMRAPLYIDLAQCVDPWILGVLEERMVRCHENTTTPVMSRYR